MLLLTNLLVQVIEYNASSRSDVENEVQLMLSFNHPNIVHAYHCVTYTCTGATTGSGTKISDRIVGGANNNHKASSAVAMSQRRGSTDGTTSALLPMSQQQPQGLQQHGVEARGHEPAARRGSAGDLSTLMEVPLAGTYDNDCKQQQVDGGDAAAQVAKDQECWTIAEREEKDSWQVQALGVIVGSARVETW